MYLQQCSPAQCRLITQIIDASDIQNKDIEEQYEQKRIKNLAFSYDLNIPLACKWLRKTTALQFLFAKLFLQKPTIGNTTTLSRTRTRAKKTTKPMKWQSMKDWNTY